MALGLQCASASILARLRPIRFLLIFNDLRIDTLWKLDALSGNYEVRYIALYLMPKYTQSDMTGRSLVPVDRSIVKPEDSLAFLNRPPNQLGLCLDASGSMESLVSSVVAGYNQLLADNPESNVTVATFGSNVRFLERNSPAGALLPMTEGQYDLYGSTALLDGFGDIIGEVAKVYDPPSKLNKPKVLIALLTDGMENASHRYQLEDLRHTVAYRRITCSWQFLYLTSSDTGYGLRLGIPATHIASFEDPESLASLLERVKKAVGAYYLGDRHFARFLLKEKN
jgi:hypothetical protein